MNCLASMLQAVRSASGRTIDIDVIHRVLLQPHWQGGCSSTGTIYRKANPQVAAHHRRNHARDNLQTRQWPAPCIRCRPTNPQHHHGQTDCLLARVRWPPASSRQHAQPYPAATCGRCAVPPNSRRWGSPPVTPDRTQALRSSRQNLPSASVRSRQVSEGREGCFNLRSAPVVLLIIQLSPPVSDS